MSQLLFLGAVVLLVAGAFWVSTRLTMKAGSNMRLPSTFPAAPDGGEAQDIRAFPLVVLSVKTVLRSPAILGFAAATATLGVTQLWLLPTEIRSWLASEQPFSTALVSSLTSTRGLATQLLSGAFILL